MESFNLYCFLSLKKEEFERIWTRSSQVSLTTKPTAFYHPDHLNTRCVVESFNS